MTLFEGLFQIAYVTGDLDRAVQAVKARYGIAEMMVTRGMRHSPATSLDLALAWIDGWMIELIEPHGDGASVYEAIVPDEGQSMRQHHLGHLLRDPASWERLQTTVAASGDPVFVEKDTGLFHYVFVDTRTTLGHFTEHMICSEEGLAVLDRIPRN